MAEDRIMILQQEFVGVQLNSELVLYLREKGVNPLL